TSIFGHCEALVRHLQKDTEVLLKAGGPGTSEKLLRVIALASADLQKASGYLPGFGRIALRLDRYEAAVHSTSPSSISGVIARLLEAPVSAVGQSIVFRKDADSSEMGRELAVLIRGEGDGLRSAEVRSVGDASADRLLQAVQLAQRLLREGGDSRLRLGICPQLGVSLSSSKLDSAELVSFICPWGSVADVVPGLLPLRARHHSRFYEETGTPIIAT
ncbi:unnamed protein product, partial [Polarella glacialis]